MRPAFLALATLLLAANLHANTYVRLAYIAGTAMCWRSGAVMQQTNAAIGLIDFAGDGFEPPSTNPANNFCGPGDAASINSNTPPALGYGQLVYQPLLATRGGIDGIIEYGGLSTLNGRFRIFSALAVTQAAYYADGGIESLLTLPNRIVTNPGTWTNNLVNPAYAFHTFDQFPVLYLDVVWLTVTGSISTVAGGADNLLDNANAMVYWRTNETHAWLPLDFFSITNNGDFYGIVSNMPSHLMVGLTNGSSALPNSLVTFGPLDLDLLPIAVARSRPNGAFVKIGPATISTTNNLAGAGYAFPVQDADTMVSYAAGLMLGDTDAATFTALIASNALNPNDRVVLSGTNVFSNGVHRLIGVTIVSNHGPASPLSAIPLSFADLQDGSITAELFESMLVSLPGAIFTTTGSFAAQSYAVTNQSGETAVIRIASTTDPLVGLPIPSMPCAIAGILSQSDATPPFTANYEILPLSVIPVPEPSVLCALVCVCAIRRFCMRRKG